MVEEDEQQTRAPFFIREEEGEREIRFQSKLINMQFVIPRGGTRVVPLFLFFFSSLSRSLQRGFSLFFDGLHEDAIENSYTSNPRSLEEFRDTGANRCLS